MKRLILFGLDFAAFFTILFVTVSVRRLEIDGWTYFNNCKIFLFVFLLTGFVLWLFSFYDFKALRKRTISYKTLAIAWTACVLLSSSFFYFLSGYGLPLLTPKAILLAVLTLYFFYVYWVRRSYFNLNFVKVNLLLFGESETLDEIRRECKASRGFTVREGGLVPQADAKYSYKNLDWVVFSSKLFKEHPQAWPVLVEKFIARGVYVDTDFNVYERLFRRVSRESIGDEMWLLRGIGARREDAMYNMLKRCMDFAAAVCLLPFCAVAGVFIYGMIKLIDKEEPLFTQKRTGLLGKTITLYKFRTIKSKGQESDKEQITRTGKYWRRFRLDEIPQLINVLQGDISLVGPRPIWTSEFEFLNQHIPNHAVRSVVKPGITGWAQLNFKAPITYVNFRHKTPEAFEPNAFDGAFTRFSYDVWYIQNRSFLLDLEIIIKTGIRMFIKDSHVA